MGRSRPNCRRIQAPHWPQDSLCGYDSTKGVHHIPVAGCGVGLEALHSCLPTKKKGKQKFRVNTVHPSCSSRTRCQIWDDDYWMWPSFLEKNRPRCIINVSPCACPRESRTDCSVNERSNEGKRSVWHCPCSLLLCHVRLNWRKYGATSSKVTRGHKLTSCKPLFPLTLRSTFLCLPLNTPTHMHKEIAYINIQKDLDLCFTQPLYLKASLGDWVWAATLIPEYQTSSWMDKLATRCVLCACSAQTKCKHDLGSVYTAAVECRAQRIRWADASTYFISGTQTLFHHSFHDSERRVVWTTDSSFFHSFGPHTEHVQTFACIHYVSALFIYCMFAHHDNDDLCTYAALCLEYKLKLFGIFRCLTEFNCVRTCGALCSIHHNRCANAQGFYFKSTTNYWDLGYG